MPVIEVNGVRKKVACGPCIRGHRSTKCDHKDRILLEVRKPGRPLSSCPHTTDSCSCSRVAFTYALPKNVSQCACPSTSETDPLNETAPSPTTPPNRVQKSRHKKSISTRSPGTLERALKASEDAERVASNIDPGSPAGEILDQTKPRLDSGALPQISNGPDSDVIDAFPDRDSQDASVPPQPLTTYTQQPPAELLSSSVMSSCCSSRPKAVKATTEPIQVHQAQTTELLNAAQQHPTQVPSGTIEDAQPTKRSCCSDGKAANQADTLTQLSQTELSPLNGDDLRHAQASSIGAAYPLANGHNGILAHNHQFSYGNNVQATTYSTSAPFALDHSAFAPVIYQHHQGSGMPHLPLSPLDGGVSNGLLHNCTCGDACACLGCAAHPRNDTTINYIRQMADFMMHQTPAQTPYMIQQPPYVLPSPLQQQFGGTIPQMMPYVPLGPPFYTNHAPPLPTYSHIPNGGTSLHQATPPVSHPQFDHMQAQLQLPTYTALYLVQATATASVSDAPRAGHATPPAHPITNPSNQESPATPEKEAFSNTILSPTSFFFNELVLGCSDATGLCQCGDGCTCVGCLTHGGHNGVPLEPPNGGEIGDMGFTGGLPGG